MPSKYNKYANKKVQLDGIAFDSRKEAKRYAELKLLEKAGEITGLDRQVKFDLVPAQYEEYERTGKSGQPLKPGKRCVELSVCYVADFCYRDKDGAYIVEDTKGYKTKDYVIKRKLMRYMLGIAIKEV